MSQVLRGNVKFAMKESMNGSSKGASSNGSLKEHSSNGSLKEVSSNGSLKEVSLNGSLKEPPSNGSLKELSSNGSLKEPSLNGSSKEHSLNGSSKEHSLNGSSKEPSVNGSLNGSLIGSLNGSLDGPLVGSLNGMDSPYQKTVLVTGGAGFIGSHTTLQLLQEGYRVVVIDSLDNSSEESVKRVADLAGKNGNNLYFFQVDLREKEDLEMIFSMAKYDAVIHFAALKAVAESVAKPLFYYRNNMIGTINLLEVMSKYDCRKLVFSSSATVYGQPKSVPCTEDFPLSTMNPYGRTKLFVEEIARDLHVADPEWRIILLRYFNPVGAHPSGLIGEDPRGIPNNLMPFLQQVAVGRRSELTVFGKDYPTIDGTGVRDYVHVMDLAVGHVAALRKLLTTKDIGCTVYNLGTGCGTSVLEMVAAFEKVSGQKIPLRFADRRPGDCAEIYASTEKAERELHWKAIYGIEDMCCHQWNWASNNPWGYRDPEVVKDS